MSEQVVATPELLEEWIFDKGRAEVLLAEQDGRPVGFALFFHNFSTFLGRAGIYLEDLFVRPEARGRGAGKALLRELAAALDAMAAAIRWQRRPLPDILAALERYPLAGPYFHRITERMWEGQTLPQAWHSVFSRLSLGAEWMTALELTGDEEKLTNGLLYTAGQLKQLCRQRGEEQRQTAKLWLAGVLSAAGLLIILLI